MILRTQFPQLRGFSTSNIIAGKRELSCVVNALRHESLQAIEPLLRVFAQAVDGGGPPVGAVIAAEEIRRAIIKNVCTACGVETFVRTLRRAKDGKHLIDELVCVGARDGGRPCNFTSPVIDGVADHLSPCREAIAMATEVMRIAFTASEEYSRRVHKRSHWWGADESAPAIPI